MHLTSGVGVISTAAVPVVMISACSLLSPALEPIMQESALVDDMVCQFGGRFATAKGTKPLC